MADFTPTDSDLVFRRKERVIMAVVFGFDALLFIGITGYVYTQSPAGAPAAGVALCFALAFHGLVTAWLWSFEIRFTPYELVVRSIFRTHVVPYSNINRLQRQRVGGKVPAQYQLRVHIHEGPAWTVPDISELGTSVLSELRSRCRNAEIIDEHPKAMSVHNPSDE